MEVKNVRTRIAPSPTGDFHIGSLRTALYNYALAKHHDGKFILRIEDTDQKRYVEGAEDAVIKALSSYELKWDEGPKVGGSYMPYFQSQRLDIYEEYAQRLLDSEHAYYCFCTPERLKQVREEQQKNSLPPKYDRHCRDLSEQEVAAKLEAGKPYVIRLKVPDNEILKYRDEVYGDLEFDTNQIDDQVLMKSDGFPTYHMAVVVDDHLMEVSHVLRGNDWLPSLPKHLLLYKFFGWEAPKHAHLPNIKEMGSNAKLSKRHGSVGSIEFLKEGYLYDAVLNFLMFLGWNPGTEKEIYSMDEFIKDFSLQKIHKTDLVVFDRQKLLWINGVYIRNLSVEELFESVMNWAQKFDVTLYLNNAPKDLVIKALSLVQERMKLLSEFNGLTYYFFNEPDIEVSLLKSFCSDSNRAKEILSNYLEVYKNMDNASWSSEEIEKYSHEALKKFSYAPKEAFMTLRVALTGQKATPPLFDLMEVLTKQTCENRIANAVELL